jgi:hypothetical protein
MEDPYLRSIYSGDRRPYDPNLAPHPQAPRAQYYPAFSPGMLAGLRDQLTKGFGMTPEEQQADLQSTYQDTTATYVPAPITQILADFAKNPYQQYGQDSGSPFLNSLLGFAPGQPPAPGTGGTGQFAPGAGQAQAPVAAPAPAQAPYPNKVPMNRDDAERLLLDRQAWMQSGGR